MPPRLLQSKLTITLANAVFVAVLGFNLWITIQIFEKYGDPFGVEHGLSKAAYLVIAQWAGLLYVWLYYGSFYYGLPNRSNEFHSYDGYGERVDEFAWEMIALTIESGHEHKEMIALAVCRT